MSGYRLVVLGAPASRSSQIGPLLGALPRNFPLPVVLVCHRAISAVVSTAVHSTRGQLFAVLLAGTGEDGLEAHRSAAAWQGIVLLHEAGEPFPRGGLDGAGLAARLREIAEWSQPC